MEANLLRSTGEALMQMKPKLNRSLVTVALAVAGVAVSAGAAAQEIDSGRSTITVHVFKSGLFRGLADNHDVRAPIKEGSLDAGASPKVRVVVDVAGMRVLDPNASAKDRAEVQTRMMGPEVLDADRFPQIRFESTAVERTASGGWTVRGQLTLHGQTRPVVASVTREQDHYKGTASLKQSDFGIAPISIAGGTVKVKDEVTIDFDVFTR